MSKQIKQPTVSRTTKQRFEMPDGSVKEIEITHRRTKAEDDQMQRAERAKKTGDPTANSSAIRSPEKDGDKKDGDKK